jgi:hypothetical protein
VSSTTSPTLMVGRVAAEPGSAFVSAVEVMNYILAVATDTMTGGQVRRLPELAGSSSLKRHNYASDEGGE